MQPNQHPAHGRSDVVIVLITTLAGALLSALIMSWYLNRDNRWVRIISPTNETAIEIVALDRGLMPYVKTQQGNLYFCSGSTWRDTCRQVTPQELPISKVHPKWLTCESAFPQTPPTPGPILDAIEVGQCSEAATYSKLVLLADGTLWQWRRTFSWVSKFASATCVSFGLGLGFVGGLAIIKVRRYLRPPMLSKRI